MRPTQVEALITKGNKTAVLLKYVQIHLDEFLSVCQVGITFTSIGLGFVGEPVFAKILTPLIGVLGGGNASEKVAHGIAITIAYILISFLHIVAGELIPKSIAIRATQKSALLVTRPLIVFRYIFIVPIWLLNSVVNLVLRMLKLPILAQKIYQNT